MERNFSEAKIRQILTSCARDVREIVGQFSYAVQDQIYIESSVLASVASLLTLWATTAQRAHAQGFLGKGDGLWRAWQVASGMKEEVE